MKRKKRQRGTNRKPRRNEQLGLGLLNQRKEARNKMPHMLEQPDKCSSCGLTTEEMQEQEIGWFLVGLSAGVGFFCCPQCQCAHVNKNVIENIKNIQAQKIIKPNIILPNQKGMN